MKTNAYDLFLSSNRFDLIFKYLYLRNLNKNSSFFSEMYLENIRAFNNFHEDEPSDGIPKETPADFINSFNKLYNNIKLNGYNPESIIPIGDNGEISDGAHRLICAALLKLDIQIEKDGRNDIYDYNYFINRGFNKRYADYGALEYVKLQKNAYIVNLHAVIDEKYDYLVEDILKKYGRIFYKKNVALNFNGYVNLKKLSYGSFWERENWIGNVENAFAGAQDHALHSKGNGKYLRAYVYVCDNPEKLKIIKQEVRDIFKIGNYCIHINDYREEAIALAELFFNDNSIQIFNTRPFDFEDLIFDSRVDEFKNRINENRLDLDDCIVGGSSPLNIVGIRKSDDIDFLFIGKNKFNNEDDIISCHDTELRYYPDEKKNLIFNNKYFFYYKGLKIISLKTLYDFKLKRGENPKDINDCKILKRLLKGEYLNKKNNKNIKITKYKDLYLYKMVRKIYRFIFPKEN